MCRCDLPYTDAANSRQFVIHVLSMTVWEGVLDVLASSRN